jgi:hypothetical protein
MPRAGMGRAFGASECERAGRCARFEFVVVWGLELNRTPRCFCSCGFPFSHWCGPASPPTSGAKPRPHPSLGQRPRLPIDQSPRAEGPAQCDPANKSGLQPLSCFVWPNPGAMPRAGMGRAFGASDGVYRSCARVHWFYRSAPAWCRIPDHLRGKAPASSQPWPTAKVTDRPSAQG